MSGGIPRRVDAATKTALLGLVDTAVEGGWTTRQTCRYLE
ncbi:MAG: putative transposase, partial [Acidimicrobiales bacterium]